MKRRAFITLGGGAMAAAAWGQAQGAPSAQIDKLVLPKDTEVRTGGSRMIEIDGGYHVWTKKVGDAPIKLLPNARAWISEKGSHGAMYDDQLPYFTELLTFLKSA